MCRCLKDCCESGWCFVRVLEASIAENKASLKRTHTEVWSDSPNPHDRKRQGNCPVGLKNVGNTCWFSAVIQVSVVVPRSHCSAQLSDLNSYY